RPRSRRPRDHRRLQSGEPVGNAPEARSPAPARLAHVGRAVPAARRRIRRLPAPARLAAPAQLRSRGRPLRLLHPAAHVGALARAIRLDGAGRRALVAGVRRALLHRCGEARARNAAGRADPQGRAAEGRHRAGTRRYHAEREPGVGRKRRDRRHHRVMKWIAYTDGACAPTNPGPSGWGAVLIAPDGAEADHFGYIGLGTNQIAELTAAIEGLALVPAGAEVELVSDSQYVLKGLTEWRAS